MRDLENMIARLEMRAEQMGLHLGNSVERRQKRHRPAQIFTPCCNSSRIEGGARAAQGAAWI